MRYELTDFEWTAIRPFLPNKPRGAPRKNDRRVLNGIFWILRSGTPRDLPEAFGPCTTCYNRSFAGERLGYGMASWTLPDLTSGAMLLADRGDDADWIKVFAVNAVRGPTFLRSEIAKPYLL